MCKKLEDERGWSVEECVHSSRSNSKREGAEKGNYEGEKGTKSRWRKGAGNTRTGGEPRRAATRPAELKFLYLNARSIVNKLDDLVVVVEA